MNAARSLSSSAGRVLSLKCAGTPRLGIAHVAASVSCVPSALARVISDDPVVAVRILKHLRTSRPDGQPHCPVHTLVHACHASHGAFLDYSPLLALCSGSGRLRTFAVPAHRPAAAVIGSTQTRADKVASKQQSVSFVPRARARCLPATALAPLRSARASICA